MDAYGPRRHHAWRVRHKVYHFAITLHGIVHGADVSALVEPLHTFHVLLSSQLCFGRLQIVNHSVYIFLVGVVLSIGFPWEFDLVHGSSESSLPLEPANHILQLAIGQ